MKRPPRLVSRTLAAAFLTVAAILSIVFIVLVVDARDRVRRAETERLRLSAGLFSSLEARLQKGELTTIATLAENPSLKAALDTYIAESRFGGLTPGQEAALRRTVALEAEALASVTGADALVVLDTDGRIYASAGGLARHWRAGDRPGIEGGHEPAFQTVVSLPPIAFRVSGASLTLGDRSVGTLVLARSLDADYARELSVLSRAGIVITVSGAAVASTLPDGVTDALLDAPPDGRDTRVLEGEEFAVATLVSSGPARIYTLSSIDEAARRATRDALTALGAIALGAFVLAGFASLWLARALAGPIDRLSTAIVSIKGAPESRRTLEPTGTSRELDALATAFNDLMRDVQAAEAETQSTYVGAIRALAAALDARDPYTAGHSQRVSDLSERIAWKLSLGPAAVDVIRLGALLHDIGKIGVADGVLRKAGALTMEEYEQIKRHPLLGARILRQVGFLAPHLPIVELHHERPDGKGYPYGLRGEEIPLPARIVHVADAFDAMTSGRAYRPARPASFALAELRRGAGTEFDEACVEALCSVMAGAAAHEPAAEELLGRGAQEGRVRAGSQRIKSVGAALAVALASLAASPAAAQQARPSPLALDVAASIDEGVDRSGHAATGVLIDAVGSMAMGRGLEAIVRPFVSRLGSGEWNRQIWVAALRYERPGPVALRVDAGLIPSPVGLSNLTLRPHLNPTISQPASLFTPLPAGVAGMPRAHLLGAVYPYGVHATASGLWWDARAAIIDSSPLRPRRVFAETNPPRFANVVIGGGVTPLVGVRIGASVTRGGWLRAGESPAIERDAGATVVTIESEVSFRHTKLSGEWVRDALETGGSSRAIPASGWFVQGQQTLTPRLFVAGRVERMSAPAAAGGALQTQRFSGIEETVGLRLTPELTLRAAHRARRSFGRAAADHLWSVSLVWWKRAL